MLPMQVSTASKCLALPVQVFLLHCLCRCCIHVAVQVIHVTSSVCTLGVCHRHVTWSSADTLYVLGFVPIRSTWATW